MKSLDIVLTGHASRRMRQRRVTLQDIYLILQLGRHADGEEKGTREACIELDGRPLTVVYDSAEYEFNDLFHIITVMRKRCQ